VPVWVPAWVPGSPVAWWCMGFPSVLVEEVAVEVAEEVEEVALVLLCRMGSPPVEVAREQASVLVREQAPAPVLRCRREKRCPQEKVTL